MDIEPTENEIQVMMELRAEDIVLEEEQEEAEIDTIFEPYKEGFPF